MCQNHRKNSKNKLKIKQNESENSDNTTIQAQHSYVYRSYTLYATAQKCK